jgi:cytochrome c5
MKKRSNIYTILIVFLLLTQQIISGCTTTVTKDIQKDELTKEDGRKEELAKEELVKEELHKEEENLFGQYLYKFICTTCHPLPDTDDYDYTPEEWSEIADSMYDSMEHRKLITLKEIEKIKDHLKKELTKDDSRKEELLKEKSNKKEEDLFGHYLYRFICTACHPLPDTGDYDYTPEEWSEIADSMYDSMEHRKLITLKEIEKIKDYLKNKSQKQ